MLAKCGNQTHRNTYPFISNWFRNWNILYASSHITSMWYSTFCTFLFRHSGAYMKTLMYTNVCLTCIGSKKWNWSIFVFSPLRYNFHWTLMVVWLTFDSLYFPRWKKKHKQGKAERNIVAQWLRSLTLVEKFPWNIHCY